MKRILFVDDEPKILLALSRSLRSFRNEWEMVFAEGGTAALDECASAAFDVVVSDARMPGMEGSELLAEVMRLYPDTVRMVLSGQCSRKSVLRCAAVAHQFLSKPCEPAVLKSAVQRVCRMRESFRDESARKAISRIQRLPSQASAYRALADAVQSPRASVEGLAKIITGDVGMTAKVVQLVSSGFFGSPQRVNSAVEAVNLLGPETVRALLASSAAFQLGSEEYREEDLELLSEHSFAVAAAASRIATTLTDDPTWIGDAYLAGALHEVGTLALAGRGRRYSSETESAASRQRAAKGRIAQALPREAAPDPGGYLLALWGLPDSVVRAIAYHRAPDRCPEQISAPLTAVHIANALLGRSWDSGDGKTVPLAMDYLQGAGCADRLESWRDICEACRPEGALQ